MKKKSVGELKLEKETLKVLTDRKYLRSFVRGGRLRCPRYALPRQTACVCSDEDLGVTGPGGAAVPGRPLDDPTLIIVDSSVEDAISDDSLCSD